MTNEKIHRISMKDVVYKADKNNEPILKIKSGDTVIFECRDAFNQVIKKPEDLPVNFDMEKINPATGPLFVEGAEPGDTLEAHILDIKLADQGAERQNPLQQKAAGGRFRRAERRPLHCRPRHEDSPPQPGLCQLLRPEPHAAPGQKEPRAVSGRPKDRPGHARQKHL